MKNKMIDNLRKNKNKMDKYAFSGILSYIDTDTQLVLNKVSKSYHVNIGTLNVYDCGSVRLVKYLIHFGQLQIDSQFADKSGLYNMSINKKNKYIVLWMLQKSKKSFAWEIVFKNACTHGWKEVVEYMIRANEFSVDGGLEQSYYVTGGLEQACQFGHIDIVKILLTIVNTYTCWSVILFNACLGGNKEIIELIAKQCKETLVCDFCDKQAIDHLKK